MNSVIQEHITELHDRLDQMTNRVVTAVDQSVTALAEKDVAKAKLIRKEDKLINKLRWDIEERCITLLATQQPVASDLREIIALLYINTELERIGDYAAGISKITVMIGEEEHIKPLIDIPRMKDLAIDMIQNAMKAYASRNEASARLIHSQDDDIDQLYNQVYRELISFMIEKPSNITQCTHLLWVTHNLERIGDRVTNICERIIYLASGERADDL